MLRSAIRVGLPLGIFMVAAAGSACAQPQPPAPTAQKPAPGERLRHQVLMEVYMVEGKTAVEGESIRILENFLEQALLFPDEPIALIGHTDNRNAPAEEVAESKAWADALGHYLVSKGISAQRISTGGEGATQPRVVVAPGVRERLNRRVNMTLGEKTRGW